MNRHQSLFPVVLAVALTLAACSPDVSPAGPPLLDVVSDGPVVVVADAVHASPGDAVPVRFANSSIETFAFNPCAREVQRWNGEAWETLPPELRLCTDVAYVLGAEAERSEPVDVPLYVQPGQYRFVFSMRPMGSAEVVQRPVSTSFEVR